MRPGRRDRQPARPERQPRRRRRRPDTSPRRAAAAAGRRQRPRAADPDSSHAQVIARRGPADDTPPPPVRRRDRRPDGPKPTRCRARDRPVERRQRRRGRHQGRTRPRPPALVSRPPLPVQPRIGDVLARRQAGQDPRIIEIAWRGQRRLHTRWQHLRNTRKKPAGVVAIAAARARRASGRPPP